MKLFKLNKDGVVAVVIPKKLCEALGLQPGVKVDVTLGRDRTIIIKEKV